MAVSFQAVSYGAVVLAGVSLFAIGTPTERAGQAASLAASSPHAAVAAPVAVANGVTLHSVGVELPVSSRSFPGEAAGDAVTANCTACHSPGMILNQPPIPASRWSEIVGHMGTNFKAPLIQSDIPAIVRYLAATNDAPAVRP